MRYRFRKHPSKLSTVMVTFGAGSRVEYNTDYPEGIAHYMEHVRFKGSEKYTAKELARKLADIGGDWNAWTSKNLVSYHITIPEDNIEKGMEYLAEVVLNPIFPQEELDKEKEVVCQEIRMYDDEISHLVSLKGYQTIFNNSLVSPICGSEKSVRSITRDHILDFNKEFYSKDHMLITIGSNNDQTQLIEKYFGIPDDVLLFAPPDKTTEYLPEAAHDVIKEGQIQNEVCISFGSEDIIDIGKNKRAEVSVMSRIFGSGMASRLFMRVREDLGLVYGISSYLNSSMDGSLYEIDTSTESENLDKVITTIDEEIEKFITHGVTQEEIDRAKNSIKSSVYGALDSSDTIASRMIYEQFMGYNNLSEYLAEIQTITTEDVLEVAKRIFSSKKYTIIGKGNEQTTKK